MIVILWAETSVSRTCSEKSKAMLLTESCFCGGTDSVDPGAYNLKEAIDRNGAPTMIRMCAYMTLLLLSQDREIRICLMKCVMCELYSYSCSKVQSSMNHVRTLQHC